MAAELKLKPDISDGVGKLLMKRRKELLRDLAELERDCFEPVDPTLAGGKLEAVHPNHRPDLAYILDTLCQVKPVLKNEPLREQVEASINGMRYIIQRTREAAPGVRVPTAPLDRDRFKELVDDLCCAHAGAVLEFAKNKSGPEYRRMKAIRQQAEDALMAHVSGVPGTSNDQQEQGQ